MAKQSNCIVTYQYRDLIHDTESLIQYIQTNKDIDEAEIKRIICAGGLSNDQLKLIKPYNTKFSQHYHNLMCCDAQQQKQCYELMTHTTETIPSKLLNITFALISKWLNLTNNKIIIYGLSLISLSLTHQVNINNCQTEDIDVAVDRLESCQSVSILCCGGIG